MIIGKGAGSFKCYFRIFVKIKKFLLWCHNCHKCLHFRGYSPRFLCNYLIFLLVLFTGGQYVWTSLCQFIFFLWTSSIVYLFDFLTFDIFLTIWHLFDNLTSFWHFDFSFNLNHLSPSQGYFYLEKFILSTFNYTRIILQFIHFEMIYVTFL